MDKRRFLAAASATTVLPLISAHAEVRPASGAGILTISGAISRSNRGPLDPLLDPLLANQGVKFDKALVLDAAALLKLPAVKIQPVIYDEKPRELAGPLVTTVVEQAGVALHPEVSLTLKAIDGYTVDLTLRDMRRIKMIVATHMNGQPLTLGGFGPLWGVYEADKASDMQDKPLKERFALCPWGLYHIEVRGG
ncbi:MAG TPA: molybdopterin-dependent oxidoreductase [Burkholderiaceae bacterium]|nr:molybdopterin-dependent oxidoreductase [Burkholderiaceae bacterium]